MVIFTINESKFKCFTELSAIFVICNVRKSVRFRHEKGLKRTGSSRLENKKPEFEFSSFYQLNYLSSLASSSIKRDYLNLICRIVVVRNDAIDNQMNRKAQGFGDHQGGFGACFLC